MTLPTELIAKATEVSVVKGVSFNEALQDVIAHNLDGIAAKFNADEVERVAHGADDDEHRDVLLAVVKLMRGKKVSFRKENAIMNKDDFVPNMVRLAKHGDPKAFEKWHWYDAICQGAQDIRKVGEDRHTARARFMREHPDGMALYNAYQMASGPSAKIDERPRPNPRSTSTLMAVDELAERLIEKGVAKTIEQARARVWQTHPELVKRYDAERTASIKKQTR